MKASRAKSFYFPLIVTISSHFASEAALSQAGSESTGTQSVEKIEQENSSMDTVKGVEESTQGKRNHALSLGFFHDVSSNLGKVGYSSTEYAFKKDNVHGLQGLSLRMQWLGESLNYAMGIDYGLSKNVSGAGESPDSWGYSAIDVKSQKIDYLNIQLAEISRTIDLKYVSIVPKLGLGLAYVKNTATIGADDFEGSMKAVHNAGFLRMTAGADVEKSFGRFAVVCGIDLKKSSSVSDALKQEGDWGIYGTSSDSLKKSMESFDNLGTELKLGVKALF